MLESGSWGHSVLQTPALVKKLSLISLEVCRRIYHCKIQVKFDIGNHPPFLLSDCPILT